MRKIVKLHDKTFQLFIREEDIQSRVGELGSALRMRYEGKRPLFVSVLNGAFIFAADLLRAYDEECEIAFVRLSSYDGLSSTGEVTTVLGLDAATVQGRDVIVVEDIVDSGKTLHDFMRTLTSFEPASLAIVSCFLKPESLNYDITTDFVGFKVPNKFIVGYGLDYDGLGRNLPAIYQLIE
jgi:hypoxanthine phosphoribosyltransferase